jgi:hypothetical protein
LPRKYIFSAPSWTVLTPILLLRALRHLSLMFLSPGATYPGMPTMFTHPAAIGDLAAALLALVGLTAMLLDLMAAITPATIYDAEPARLLDTGILGPCAACHPRCCHHGSVGGRGPVWSTPVISLGLCGFVQDFESRNRRCLRCSSPNRLYCKPLNPGDITGVNKLHVLKLGTKLTH